MSKRAPRNALAAQAARKSAPSTGGIMRPHFDVWYEDADNALSLSVYSKKYSFSDIEGYRNRKILPYSGKDNDLISRCEYTVITTMSKKKYKKARSDSCYNDHTISHYDDDDENATVTWVYTPVRSYLHLDVLKFKNVFEAHPWAKFITWFGGNIPDPEDTRSSIFTPLQCIYQPTNFAAMPFFLQYVHTLRGRFIGFPYVFFTDTQTGRSRRFFLYGGGQRTPIGPDPDTLLQKRNSRSIDPKAEFKMLQKTIKQTIEISKKFLESSQEMEEEGEGGGEKSVFHRVKCLGISQCAKHYTTTSLKLLCAPVPSAATLETMRERGMLDNHPWGRFLIEFPKLVGFFHGDITSIPATTMFGGSSSIYSALFTPLQRINMPKYTIQFVYDVAAEDAEGFVPYVMFTSNISGELQYFFIYGFTSGDDRDSSRSKAKAMKKTLVDPTAELTRLQDEITRLENFDYPTSESEDEDKEDEQEEERARVNDGGGAAFCRASKEGSSSSSSSDDNDDNGGGAAFRASKEGSSSSSSDDESNDYGEKKPAPTAPAARRRESSSNSSNSSGDDWRQAAAKKATSGSSSSGRSTPKSNSSNDDDDD